jgi:hypothetical protein
VRRPLRLLIVFLLVALAITYVCVFDRVLLHFLGWDGQTSDNYSAWSGSVPAIVSIVGMSTIITGLWHSVNCHVDRCMRVGRYHVAGGAFRVCRRHHPADEVRHGNVSHSHIKRWHDDHA